MLEVKNILPSDKDTEKHIFDFAEEGTVGRAIFEDDNDLLQKLLATQSDEGRNECFNIEYFFYFHLSHIYKVNRIGLAALFGSVKCFKYLLMSGEVINEETCVLSVSGGNNEIIHLCEQKGLVLDGILHFIIDMKYSNGSTLTLFTKKFIYQS